MSKHKQLPIPPCPPDGISTPAKVIEIDDADTITVEIKRVLRVRLLNFSRAELSTAEGQEETKQLAARLPLGSRIHIFIPAFKEEQLLDNTSFNRVLAFGYNENKEPL